MLSPPPVVHYLHAHWRMEYVRAPRESRGTPFASALEAEEPRKCLLLHRDRHSFILMNRFPYNAGHLLVLPIREVVDLSDLHPGESEAFFAAILRAQRALKRVLSPDGFNIGINVGAAAGAGIPGHLHCHVIPRWNGDTNFMPIIGATRVLPQALEDLYDQLLPHMGDE